MGYFFLTLLVGAAVGFLFNRIKVPGGMMIGSIVGVTALNIITGNAFMPSQAKVFAQITAGAYIGCTVEKKDLLHMRHIIKPALIITGSYLVLSTAMGLLIYSISPLDWITSAMSSVPGGMSDTPLVAADLGADTPKVAVMQFVRLIAGVGIFPSLINLLVKQPVAAVKTQEIDPTEALPAEPANETTQSEQPVQTAEKYSKHLIFLLTIGVASVFGYLGKWTGIPAGTVIFALFSVIGLKLLFDKAYLPMWMKRVAQVLSGAYIGCSMLLEDLLELRHLIVPAIVLVTGYTIACLVIGTMLHRFCGLPQKIAMLAATPGGASDMALISSDMGINSADLLVLQIIRMVVVVSIFPQLFSLMGRLFF